MITLLLNEMLILSETLILRFQLKIFFGDFTLGQNWIEFSIRQTLSFSVSNALSAENDPASLCW